jgi:serine/threonine protein kinase
MDPTPVPDTSSVPGVPPKIGKYRIVRELGRGPISRVYLGHDPFEDREVAIKAIHLEKQSAASARSQFESTFLNQAALARRLTHPHIIKIHDADVESDLCYIVMEYVDGHSLDKFCEVNTLLPLHTVVELTFKCALALDFANRQGVVHRDLKPTNILQGKNGDLKLTDFGYVLQFDPELTHPEGIAWPMYMSPEQIQDAPVTHQTDIYSLGAVMYRLLTGKSAITASNKMSLLHQIVNLQPVAPSVHRADLPADLDRIILKAIAKNPADRYQNWIDFARDLTSLNKELSLPQETITDTEKFSALKAVKFFREFADLEAWETVRIATFHRVQPGETLVREGDTCNSFFLIVQGGARVIKGSTPVSVLGDEDCFGEMPYFEDRGPRTSSVVSITPMTVIEVNATAFRHSSDACQKQFNRAFLRILHDRIERLSKANLQMVDAMRKAQKEVPGQSAAK